MKRAFRVFLVLVCIFVMGSIGLWHYAKQTQGTQASAKLSESKKVQRILEKKAVKVQAKTKVSQKPVNTPVPKVEEVSLLAVGDNLIHSQIIRDGNRGNGKYDFNHLYDGIRSDVKKADYAVINQETILGGTKLGCSGYPRFNSPTQVGDAVVKAGFNIVLHATNHSMDRGEVGMQNSLNYWKTKKGVTVLGANKSQTERNTIRIVNKNGIRIAMLNYTFSLNGLPMPKDRRYMVDLLEENKVKADIEKAKKESDFIIVFPHWGTEYMLKPVAYQKKWASIFLDAGVDLVIGAHPHVVEPIEWMKREDGHKMLVYYSLGNYISSQTDMARMLGGMAKLTIKKKGDEHAYIDKANVTPIVTHIHNGHYTVYKLKNYSESLARVHKLRVRGTSFSKAGLEALASQVFGKWRSDR
ncbi:capsule biosynthesis protein capA [Lachnospiraceae bacterium KM106-2]|nr:capsule biosynthesis protein capA [Lachnospiraceae bacterium KM106-2]